MLKLCLTLAAVGSALAGPLALQPSPPNVPHGDINLAKRSYTSSAWGGAFHEGSGWYYVEGTVQVPSVSGQSGRSASAWVGIDGWNSGCFNILQTGFNMNGDGTLGAWTEWYPLPSKWYDETLYFNAGDNVRMTVTATSATSGNTTMTNMRTGQTVSQQYYNTGYPLCGSTAEWIVEDYGSSDGSGAVPFADFGSVTFRNTYASGNNGNYNAAGSNIVNLYINGSPKTDCGANSNGVLCNYVN